MSETLGWQIIRTALEMERLGINQGVSGNVSARCEQGMLITPSGMPYQEMEPSDLALVNDDGSVTGDIRPSSEWRFHHDIYRAFDSAGAIVHAHSRHATALACMNRGIPAFHYMVAVAGGKDIRCSEYATFGSQQLSDHVVEALQGRRACLMAHHGFVCYGSDLEAALGLAVEVEQLAATYLQCLQIAEPENLDDEEMERVLEKFSGYGPPR